MKINYTATDIFRLKKTLKLLAEIEGMIPNYVDNVFSGFTTSYVTTRNLKTMLFTKFPNLTKEKLPGLTKNKLEGIVQQYHRKKKDRFIIHKKVDELHLKNRLLPCSYKFYEEFGKRNNHCFNLIMYIMIKHQIEMERVNLCKEVK